jgi:hypothetical protein
MSDGRKAPLDLVPLQTLCGAARVLAHGNSRPHPGTNKPRAPGDFIELPLTGKFYASLLRHVMDMQKLHGVVSPESLAVRDRDSGLPVIDHVICNAIIIRAMLIRDGLLPVDPSPEPSPEAVAAFFKAAEVNPNADGPMITVHPLQTALATASAEAGPIYVICTIDAPCDSCKAKGESK